MVDYALREKKSQVWVWVCAYIGRRSSVRGLHISNRVRVNNRERESKRR